MRRGSWRVGMNALHHILGIDRVDNAAGRAEINRFDRFTMTAEIDDMGIFAEVFGVKVARRALHGSIPKFCFSNRGNRKTICPGFALPRAEPVPCVDAASFRGIYKSSGSNLQEREFRRMQSAIAMLAIANAVTISSQMPR